MNSKNRFIELSHSIENGLITYKGLPAPTICDDLSREASKEKYEDATFQIGKIEMLGNRVRAWTARFTDMKMEKILHRSFYPLLLTGMLL
jgi:hypothetical protein